MKQPENTQKLKELKKPSSPAYLTTGQAARHCQVSIPALKGWIRSGRLTAFKTPGGHSRIELGEFQRFLLKHGMPTYPVASPTSRILIVDDEPLIVDLFVELLTRDPRGFTLETATNGYDALIKVGSFKPSVLILDVVMPELDGVEVCRRLKEDPETRRIKILGVTGYPDSVPDLIAAGADACLTKPLNLRKMEPELERLLSV